MTEKAKRSRASKKKRPQRTCVGCRTTRDQRQLVRLVRAEDGEVWVDHPHRLGGRGAYVCSRMTCLSKALRSSKLSRALGGATASSDANIVASRIVERVSRRIMALLATAGQTRKVVIGSADSESLLRRSKEKELLVLVASDLSPRARQSLEVVAKRAEVDVVGFGDKDRLGMAFDRTTVGAITLTDAGIVRAVVRELELLHGFGDDEGGLTSTMVGIGHVKGRLDG